MKPEIFHIPGALRIERQRHREGPPLVYVAWKPNQAQSFTDTKALLKFCAWPKSTPTGQELRDWLESFKAPVAKVEEAEINPVADTKMVT